MDLAGLKALDTRTVKVPFTSPYASFIDQLAYWYFLFIIPDGFNPAAQKPNGTGPFVYQSFTPEQRSVFTRNKSFWKSGLPYVDTLTVIDFPDNPSLQDALTTGVIHAAGGFDGPELAALGAASGVKTVASHTGAITPFTMRVDQAPFNDVRVRQALRLLVDRPQLIDSALDGYGVVAADVFSPYDPDFDHSLHREQDIPQAKALLKAARAVWKIRPSGVVRYRSMWARRSFSGPMRMSWTTARRTRCLSSVVAVPVEVIFSTEPFPRLGSAAADRGA